jgi:hypothetical protein
MHLRASGVWLSLLMLVVAALPSHAHAIVLFRGDSRPPQTVFAQGFSGPGANTDPLLHLTGAHCLATNGAAEWTSAYISLTERDADLARFGTYVYNIVPDFDAPLETRTYEVASGLRNLQTGSQLYGLSLYHMDLVANLLVQPMVLGQHLARRVAPESIQSVDIYEYDAARNEAVFVRSEVNPRYRAPARADSRPIFSAEMVGGIRSGGHPSQIRAVASAHGIEQSVCLLPSPACFDRAPHLATPQATGLFPAPTCVVRPALPPNGLFRQTLQIILD